jgi:ParB-like chromosome segregation protein Spo0J
MTNDEVCCIQIRHSTFVIRHYSIDIPSAPYSEGAAPMQITLMPITKLRPAPYNPRLELPKTDPRYRKLRRSLRDFGLVEPLVWNRRTGHVVGGHQRLRILRQLGVREVPVSIVDLPPEREKALNVVLNNREAQADWDVARLEKLLEELAASPGIDLRETGFDHEHLDLLRDRLTPAEASLESPEKKDEEVEIVLTMAPEVYETVRPALDELLRGQAIECHVRWR